METNSVGFVVDVASNGAVRFRPVSRFERLLEPAAILVVGLVAILLVLSF
jgi:hypothetical protein